MIAQQGTFSNPLEIGPGWGLLIIKMNDRLRFVEY